MNKLIFSLALLVGLATTQVLAEDKTKTLEQRVLDLESEEFNKLLKIV